jgi:hypothetical protein
VLRAELSADITEMSEHVPTRSPLDVAVQQAGALRCVWANAGPVPPREQQGPAFAQATLDVMTDAEGVWDRVVKAAGLRNGPSPYGSRAIGPVCHKAYEGAAPNTCLFDALLGDYWVSLTLIGVHGREEMSTKEMWDSARKVIDPLVAVMAHVGDPAPLWTPPAEGTLPGIACDTLLRGEQATAMLGVDNLEVGTKWHGSGTAVFTHGMDVTGSDRCAIYIAGTDVGVGGIAYLPGGGWGYRDLVDTWLAAGAVETQVVGALPDERFVLECAVPEEFCRLDMLVGEDWIQLELYPVNPDRTYGPGEPDQAVIRTKVEALGETILANLHAAASG